jgi:flagellar protein FliO/FliZ
MTLKRQSLHVALSAGLLGCAFASASAHAEPAAAPEVPAKAVAAKAATPKRVSTGPVIAAPEPVVTESDADVDAPEPAAVPAKVKPVAPAASSGSARSYLRAQAPVKKPVASAPSMSPLRVALMGGFVAGLGVWALLKRRKHQTVARATRSDLEIVSSARVGNKAQVVVVNVGGRKVLLGVTESEVTRLAWLDSELDGDGAVTESFDDQEPAPFVQPPQSRASAPSVPTRSQPTRPAETRAAPSRFREALLGALGQNQKPSSSSTSSFASDDAAVAIAESTQDVVMRSSRVAVPAEAPASMVDVEGQARGLVLRLQKRA